MRTRTTNFATRLALLNLSTLLFALIGVLARVIHLPSGQKALGRGLFAGLALLALLLVRRQRPFHVRAPRDALPLAALAVTLCGNWWFYFKAIDLSSVAVAVIALFTYPLITTLLEPLLFRERYRWVDLVGAAMVVVGVATIARAPDGHGDTRLGLLAGMASAVSIALNNLLSRRMVRSYPTTQLMFLQFVGATLFFLPAAVTAPPTLTVKLVGQLVLLGAVLSTGAYVLFLDSLRYFTSSTASVLLSLQPLYATLLAWWILGERPGPGVVVGGALITGSVVAVILYHSRLNRKEPRHDEPHPDPVRPDA